DLMDWALTMSEGHREWKDSLPLPWEKECERFFTAVKKLDDYLASEKSLQTPAENCFRVRSPTRSPTWARSLCCGGWRVWRSRARIILWLRLRWGEWGQIRRRRARSFEGQESGQWRGVGPEL